MSKAAVDDSRRHLLWTAIAGFAAAGGKAYASKFSGPRSQRSRLSSISELGLGRWPSSHRGPVGFWPPLRAATGINGARGRCRHENLYRHRPLALSSRQER